METLIFQNCRMITHENYKELEPVYLEQMAISATLGFGTEYTTAEHFLEQSGDGEIEQGELELWDVVSEKDKEKVLYDCWVYLADTANVLEAGTAIDTGVGMCQWYFEGSQEDKNDSDLATALQKAFDSK